MTSLLSISSSLVLYTIALSLFALCNQNVKAFQALANHGSSSSKISLSTYNVDRVYRLQETLKESQSASSAFSGYAARANQRNLCAKRKVPVQYRGGQGNGDIQQQRAQFEEIQKATETMPVFSVLVRHKGGIPKWYPVAGFQGDGNSKAIVDAYIGDGFMSGLLKDVYKQQIEASISKSVFDQERKLIGDAVKQFPELKKVKFNLEFGFSITYGPYNRKLGKNPPPTVLNKEMMKSIFQKASENFNLTVKETFGGGSTEEKK